MQIHDVLLATSPVGILVVDGDGVCQGLNPVACQVLGVEVEQCVGRPTAAVLPGLLPVEPVSSPDVPELVKVDTCPARGHLPLPESGVGGCGTGRSLASDSP